MSNLFFQNPLSQGALTRRREDRKEDLRGHFFRDTTAILHSYPFRRLKHKTQVFFAPNNDHICTRIEHVMHVASVASTICRPLGLDSDLAWAIGLGHDLGHTPFGHLGESIIAELLQEEGGFHHELYSLRVVDSLSAYGRGLNLCYAVRDGILTHCGEKFEQDMVPDFTVKDLEGIKNRDSYPATWEGVAVRMSDKIAYLGRDMEDALQLGMINREEIPENVRRNLGNNNGEIINTLVLDLITCSQKTGRIGFSDEVFPTLLELKDFNYRRIYSNPGLTMYHDYFKRIILILHEYLLELIGANGFDISRYAPEKNFLALRFGDYLKKMEDFYTRENTAHKLIVADYIAGMTDDYAIDCIKEIMIPQAFLTQFDMIIPPLPRDGSS